MKIAVIGTGGVGGYFGGRIAKAGYEVTFFARGAHLKAIESKGLTVKSLLGDFYIEKLKVTDKLTSIGESDLIILAVKAWQVKELLPGLIKVVGPKSIIMPLQNGVSSVEELKVHFNEINILNSLCRIFSKIESPGVINHFGVTPTVIFGETNNSKTTRILKIKELFDSSGITSEIPGDISAEVWKKFIPICLGGLLAVSRTTFGELRSIPETRQMMLALMQEIYSLSQRIGIQIETDFVEKAMLLLDTYPYDSTASLTRDVMEGKPSEIEFLNGTVVKLGRQYGIETPINSFVYNCILPMELKARKGK
jgi:2-dehydropantoate 2-reductase